MPPSLKLAIVGAGPSSFYVASRILQLVPPSSPYYDSVRIHMYDRLWSPHGLVRYGVAPDHPEVKNCTHKFDAAAKDPRLRFFGNVNIASSKDNCAISGVLQLPLSKITPHYTHLLFASGCTVPNLHPLHNGHPKVISALSLVHWYTAHPAIAGKFHPPLDTSKHVTIIGNGNVALDIARILLSSPERLATYDVPKHALDRLRQSKVEHVSIVGRRGPAQAAFTAKELREMMNLEGTSFVPLDPDLIKEAEATPRLERPQKRILDILKKSSKETYGTTRKTWDLKFFRSPTAIQPAPNEDNGSFIVELAHTALSPTGSAVKTGLSDSQHTSLLVYSVGHHGEPDAPWYDAKLGHIRNQGGQVVDESGNVVQRVYASGWAGIGARGVLATTMMNAYAVAERILGDTFPDTFTTQQSASSGAEIKVLPDKVEDDQPPPMIGKAEEAKELMTYDEWRIVDEEEIRRGQEVGKERERMDWNTARLYLQNYEQKFQETIRDKNTDSDPRAVHVVR